MKKWGTHSVTKSPLTLSTTVFCWAVSGQFLLGVDVLEVIQHALTWPAPGHVTTLALGNTSRRSF